MPCRSPALTQKRFLKGRASQRRFALSRRLLPPRPPRLRAFQTATSTIATGGLSDADFQRLLQNSLGVVSGSLGEGFCGPAASALALRKPLVAPRHTAIADFLIEDYPYSFATRAANLGFARDPLRVYHPGSTWHVPEPYALAGALTRLAIDSPKR